MTALRIVLCGLGSIAAGLAMLCHPAGASALDGSDAMPIGTAQPAMTAKVFKSDGTRQCEVEGGISIDEMRQFLTDAGIPVVAAACGEMTGIQVLAVCGGPTRNINVFTISALDLDRALDLGFADVADLSPDREGTRWRPLNCE